MSDIAYTDPSPRKQCDHICLGEYGHDSPHFYGYRSGTPVDEINRLIDEIERLREELKYQTLWAELLSGNKCHCVAEDAGVCMPCAYRQTMRQNEARRG